MQSKIYNFDNIYNVNCYELIVMLYWRVELYCDLLICLLLTIIMLWIGCEKTQIFKLETTPKHFLSYDM